MQSSSLSADDLRRVIERELQPQETLIWVGQPDPAKFSREVMRACLLALGTIAVLGTISVALISHLSRFSNPSVPAILLVGSMIAFFLIAAPWSYPKRVRRAVYAITNRRVLIYCGFGWSLFWLEALPDLYSRLASFDARQVRARRRIQRYPGRADLIFDGESHQYMTGRGQIRDWIQVGFLGLGNVDEVEELLDRQYANVDTEWI